VIALVEGLDLIPEVAHDVRLRGDFFEATQQRGVFLDSLSRHSHSKFSFKLRSVSDKFVPRQEISCKDSEPCS
jgi:hypothetical protein